MGGNAHPVSGANDCNQEKAKRGLWYALWLPTSQTHRLPTASLRPERAPQEDSTLERLRQEHDVLTGTVSYLRAKLALEGAFNADAEGGGGEGGGSSGGEAT